ncbi:hypothetical protein FQN54_003111 [Arachnomyces sp. PD_36]|nr:hypothetical protein FQN54_003111 [Arachnomyces sp. PD_36]
MLCHQCRTLITTSRSSPSSLRLLSQSNSYRSYSSTPSLLSSAPTPNAPSITLPSTGAAPPEGATSEGSSKPTPPSSSSSTPPAGRVQSSCIVGTKLQGLNYMKNKPDLVALDDSEYPSWLWGLLDNVKASKKADGGEGEIQMNRKQRKRHEKKMAALEAAKPRKIPVHEQSIDITSASETANAGDDLLSVAVKGQEKRGEITKSAREARRKGIREANFLKGL